LICQHERDLKSLFDDLIRLPRPRPSVLGAEVLGSGLICRHLLRLKSSLSDLIHAEDVKIRFTQIHAENIFAISRIHADSRRKAFSISGALFLVFTQTFLV